MAAIRGRGQPAVGSVQWIQDENAQVSMFCGQEVEDFAFSARNEVEWLNEHMAQVFSKDQINVVDIFKTPGKLRGKTPRTVRKRNPLEVREPLSNIFSINPHTSQSNGPRPSPNKISSPLKIATFKVAEDASEQQAVGRDGKTNTDSSYDVTGEEMDIDKPVVHSAAGTRDTLEDFPPTSSRAPSPIRQAEEANSTDRSTTERSFHSAREELTKKVLIDDVESTADVEAQNNRKVGPGPTGHVPQVSAEEKMEIDTHEKEADDDLAVEDTQTSSQESSPARQLVRKSSLTFAALPAREPITTKKSMGSRISRTSQLEQTKVAGPQSSAVSSLTGGKSLGGLKHAEQNDPADQEVALDKQERTREEPDHDAKVLRLHNKSSTQRLHERINLLGKSQPPRPTKSIPAATVVTQPLYPELPKQEQQKQPAPGVTEIVPSTNDEDEDDWIQPPRTQDTAQKRPPSSKSVSSDIVRTSKTKQTDTTNPCDQSPNDVATKLTSHDSQAAIPISGRIRSASASASPVPVDIQDADRADPFYPDIGHPADASTTPITSPSSKRYVNGPLSASKSKLQSIMKTARGLFSSSAGISAQAKMETMSPSLAPRSNQTPSQNPESATQHGAPKIGDRREIANDMNHSKPLSREPATAEVRKTRSSTEKEHRRREQQAAERQQAEAEREKLRQQETAITANAQTSSAQRQPARDQERPSRQSPRKTQNQELPNTEYDSQAKGRPSQVQKLKDVRRPMKPTKDSAPQAKAPPLNIRIGMPSRRMPLTNTATSSAPDPSASLQSRAPGLVKKASNASIQSVVSTAKAKSSVAPPKPKALKVAERKKEQDEREAQRKLDQKLDIERKRAAQQEELRRQEQIQRQEAEKQRELEKQREKDRATAADDARKKQAIEKRRLELQKKDQRPPNHVPPGHLGSSTNRPELGGARPPSRQQNVPDHHRHAANHHPVNPAKAPIKRVFDPENDSVPARPANPQGGQNYQQNDSKRRRTNDEELEEFPIRPTKAPPIRQSGMRKDVPKQSNFGDSHGAAPSLFKSTTTNQAFQQHYQQNQQLRQAYHADTSKYREGNKIPFAENPNPPNTHQQSYKTPLPSKIAHTHRQSPQYQDGENVHLEEIDDSDESDSSPDTAQRRRKEAAKASLPSWVHSPNLRNALEEQEDRLNADDVFGPVASPHMEEMFRERHHRFRSRTSSANWAGQDRLTEEEIRRDVEARARMRRDGGWTFGL